MLWAVWGHFQGGSLYLTSLCWFLRLTSSVALWGGGMLQTNSAVVCTQCLSPAGPVPSHGTQTAPVLRCSARNHLRPVLGCVHLPGLSRSGSARRAQICLGLLFVPFPGPSSSGVWRARSLRLVAFSAAAAQLSGWTAGAPCEADGDCPAPPEVLAKEPVCSLVSKVSPGLQLPLSVLTALAARPRQGMVCSWLFPFRPLFCARSWRCLMFELFAW